MSFIIIFGTLSFPINFVMPIRVTNYVPCNWINLVQVCSVQFVDFQCEHFHWNTRVQNWSSVQFSLSAVNAALRLARMVKRSVWPRSSIEVCVVCGACAAGPIAGAAVRRTPVNRRLNYRPWGRKIISFLLCACFLILDRKLMIFFTHIQESISYNSACISFRHALRILRNNEIETINTSQCLF